MSGRIGVELTPTRLRAVKLAPLGRRVARTADVPWDPSVPADGVRALRDALAVDGPPSSIALAFGLGFLRIARVALPPATPEAREAMVAMEPSRWFATESPVLASLRGGEEIAFAVDDALAEACCAAFATWGPLERCEGAPLALARALAPTVSGTFAIDAMEGELGIVELRGGRLAAVRRIPATLDDGAAAPLADVPDVPATHVVALGAALADDSGNTGILAPPTRRQAMRARSVRRVVTAAAAALAAITFFAQSADRWRERTLAAFEAEASHLATSARPALTAQERMAALAQERGAIGVVVARRPDPAAALAAIAQALPEDAVVLSARAAGDEWRLEGTAGDAAALVPALDRDGRFDDVRTMSASSRFRDGARTRETFSLALRFRAKP